MSQFVVAFVSGIYPLNYYTPVIRINNDLLIIWYFLNDRC